MRLRYFLAAMLFSACGTSSPTAVENAQRFDMPDGFRDTYWAMEDCTHTDGDPDRVHWFRVLNSTQTADSITRVRDTFFVAEWRAPHDVYIGYSEANGQAFYSIKNVIEGSLRDIMQTDDLPQWVQDQCGWPSVP